MVSIYLPSAAKNVHNNHSKYVKSSSYSSSGKNINNEDNDGIYVNVNVDAVDDGSNNYINKDNDRDGTNFDF